MKSRVEHLNDEINNPQIEYRDGKA